jgi:hypothetical protein
MATGKVNAGIFSAHMDNIPQEALDAQAAVVKRFNPLGYDFHQIRTGMRHGYTLDAIWHLNGVYVRPEFADYKPQFKYDVIMFLDIDCIPLTEYALNSYIQQAYDGVLVGNIQRTNHIQNNQHVFVAPSAMAISVDTFKSIGSPSAIETARSDVGEEYTWLAEQTGAYINMYMPLSFDAAPAESPSWALADGMPHYGRGTTFGGQFGGMFWHNFQSFHPGQHERFMAKCNSILHDGDNDDGKSQHIQPHPSPQPDQAQPTQLVTAMDFKTGVPRVDADGKQYTVHQVLPDYDRMVRLLMIDAHADHRRFKLKRLSREMVKDAETQAA